MNDITRTAIIYGMMIISLNTALALLDYHNCLTHFLG